MMDYRKFNNYWKALHACHTNIINLAKELEQRKTEENPKMESFIAEQLRKEFQRMDDLYQTVRQVEEYDILTLN